MTKYKKITAQYMNNTLELIVVVGENFNNQFEEFKSGLEKDLKDAVGINIPVIYSVLDMDFQEVIKASKTIMILSEDFSIA